VVIELQRSEGGQSQGDAFLILGREVSLDGSRRIAKRLAALVRVQTNLNVVEEMPVDGNAANPARMACNAGFTLYMPASVQLIP
jgi:hypothetical protein